MMWYDGVSRIIRHDKESGIKYGRTECQVIYDMIECQI